MLSEPEPHVEMPPAATGAGRAPGVVSRDRRRGWARSTRGPRLASWAADAMTHPLLRALVSLALLGCASERPQEGPLVSPPFGDGKADVGDRVVDRGPLAYGVAVEAEIVEDLEFHGYTLAARPGAIVTLDVTQRG